MALIDIVQEITSGYELETSSFSGFFGLGRGKIVNLKEDVTQELFLNMFAKICKKFGLPSYVHSFYGYIWQKDGEILAYNLYEKQYNYDVIAFFIFKRMPLGKKLTYEEDAKLNGAVKEILAKHELNYDNFVHYVDRKYMMWGENAETQILLILHKKSMEFYCSKKEPYENGLTRVVPHYSCKKRINLSDLSAVQQALEDCLNVEE